MSEYKSTITQEEFDALMDELWKKPYVPQDMIIPDTPQNRKFIDLVMRSQNMTDDELMEELGVKPK